MSKETPTDPVPAKSCYAFAVVRNHTPDGFAVDSAVASSVIRNGFATGIPLRTSTKALRAPMQGPAEVAMNKYPPLE